MARLAVLVVIHLITNVAVFMGAYDWEGSGMFLASMHVDAARVLCFATESGMFVRGVCVCVRCVCACVCVRCVCV